MDYRLSLAVSGLMALLAAAPLPASGAVAQPVEVSTTQDVDFAPGGSIRLENSFGTLTVEGWDQDKVEVTVVKSAGFSGDAARARRFLDQVHVETVRRSDTELAISTTRQSRGIFRYLPWNCPDTNVTVEYRIRAPRNSQLTIRHSDGLISVTGMTGDIDAADRRGDIVLMMPDLAGYSVDARTGVGVVISDGAAGIHRRRLTGERLNSSPSGAKASRRLVLRMGFGGIAIKDLPPEAIASAKQITP